MLLRLFRPILLVLLLILIDRKNNVLQYNIYSNENYTKCESCYYILIGILCTTL